MPPDTDAPAYFIWGVDHVVYGPVTLPTLVNWVQEARVEASTWVYLEEANEWCQAGSLTELKPLFARAAGKISGKIEFATGTGTELAVNPGSLRRIKLLAGLTDAQLVRFTPYMELRHVRPFEEIVKEGAPGDGMFLLLDGEVRVRLVVAGKETILATLGAGEFFGEIALFDRGPRTADVIANSECMLLRIPAGAFQKLVQEAPDLAAPFLNAIGHTLIARIRADNKRYRESLAFARTVRC
jgi:hypothetical protein